MEIVKRAIRLMHEGKCIYDQFQLDEDYNVPDAKEDVGNVIEGTVCVCLFEVLYCTSRNRLINLSLIHI